MDVVRSGWLGERLDVGYAIDVLHPRAIRPARMIKVGDDPKPVDLSDD
jgi:hypothetical protein